MRKTIIVKPIGIIHTPYKKSRGIPIQGKFARNIYGVIRLFPEYQEGLKDIEGFFHLILIYYFNRSEKEELLGKPFLENKKHGIFAMRSPHRQNHIGFSIVRLEKVSGTMLTFSEVDIFDKTPLLDIKPYIAYFDSRQRVRNGWLSPHFKNKKLSRRITLSS